MNEHTASDYAYTDRQELIRSVQRDDYCTAVEPDYWIKLGRAYDWLDERQINRARVMCSHRYTDSYGVRTWEVPGAIIRR